MAKGQKSSGREPKKPKADKKVAPAGTSFITPSQSRPSPPPKSTKK